MVAWGDLGWRWGSQLLLVGFCAVVGCREGAGGGSEKADRKHVLLITVDTLRADHVGKLVNGLATTPFVDTLRATGYEFTGAVAPVPRTTQALASMLTGCYPHATKVRTLWDSLAPNVVSLAELAQKRGYATIAVVSNHILVSERGLNRGFDVYDHANDTRDAAGTTAAAISYLRDRRAEESLFVWVHYIDPHVPYFPPPELAERFDPTYTGRYRLHFGAVRGGVGDLAYPEDLPKAQAVFRNTLPEEVNAHIRKLYAADVRNTDDEIARLVGWVRGELGEDWLIVFTADHGESLGEHDFYYDHGDYVYNASLRVPLLFAFGPGDPLRRVGSSDSWVSLVDVAPTLAELLGFSMPGEGEYSIEGRSLVPYLRGEELPPRPVFAECGNSFFQELIHRRVTFDVAGRFRTVISGDWKLIWTPGQVAGSDYELYNLRTDPDEVWDVYAPDHPEVARLQLLLSSWVRATDESSGPLTAEDRAALKALGYLEDDGDAGD